MQYYRKGFGPDKERIIDMVKKVNIYEIIALVDGLRIVNFVEARTRMSALLAGLRLTPRAQVLPNRIFVDGCVAGRALLGQPLVSGRANAAQVNNMRKHWEEA